jgi:hypothetical protein
MRDSIAVIDGKKVEDICITYIKKPKEWADELKKAGFKAVRIIRNYKNDDHKALIVGTK